MVLTEDMIIDNASLLSAANKLTQRIGAILDFAQLQPALLAEVVSLCGCASAAMFLNINPSILGS